MNYAPGFTDKTIVSHFTADVAECEMEQKRAALKVLTTAQFAIVHRAHKYKYEMACGVSACNCKKMWQLQLNGKIKKSGRLPLAALSRSAFALVAASALVSSLLYRASCN